nr:hypothetical protein [Tanacetum cinerariifolium]
MVEAAQILTGGKLDPSKISKSPAAVAQRSVQTFVRKRSSKSTQGLDYSDVDFSPRDSVAADSFILAEEVVPADKGVSTAFSNKGKGIADEEARKKRLANLSKSDSEYAKQVAQTMEKSHAEPAPQVPVIGPLPSIKRQRDLDDMIARFSNTEWMILMARVKDFPEVAKEILGADVNDDNFSSRLQALVDKRKSAMSIQRTMEWANKFKGDDLIVEYNKIKSVVEHSPSLRSTPADEVPADTGVSTDESVPADQRVPADQSVPADTSIPAGTCVSAEDDPDAAHTVVPSGLGTIHTLLCHGGIRKTFTTLREILHMVDRQTLIRLYGFVDALSQKQPLDGLALSLWGDLKIILDTLEADFSSLVWQDQHKEYPLEIGVMEQLLDHKLQIEKDPVGNTITTAVQLIQRYLKILWKQSV